MGVVQAEDITTIYTTNGETLELQTTYGEGDSSVTTNYTVLGQEVPYTYKFDNLYGDTENGNTTVDTSVTVLEQPVTFTYKTPSDYTTATDRVTDLSSANVDKVLFQNLSTYSNGAAIYNTANNSNINIVADFIGNYASSRGGAIYNKGAIIGNITGDFISNHALSGTLGYGGAIYNSGTIGDISGNFIGNYASTTSSYGNAYGGAIHNESNNTIGDITGNFIGNYASSISLSSSNAYGGAIYNGGTIGDITGDFIGNYASSNSGSVYGGAIYNSGTIGEITGDFIGNYASRGGAIYNDGTIGDITGVFIGNYTTSRGGAIYNDGRIADITGDFISNNANGSSASGGAIYNSGTIGDISGNFIGNYASTSSSYGIAYGGAIYNVSNNTIGDITGNFIGNYASVSSSYGTAYGGAIYNGGTIGDITGNFIGNYASVSSSYGDAYGGAIYNGGTIGDITGDFIGNYASLISNYVYGGAIYNAYGTIGNITGDFIGNHASSNSGSVYGGAIYNTGTIGDITGDFIGNYAQGTKVYGGAIANKGAIIGNITGDFIDNYASSNSGNVFGGAINNSDGSTIGTKDAEGNVVGGIINSNFINNYAVSETGVAQGGAIYTSKDLNIITKDGYNSLISGNYVKDGEGKRPEAIHVANNILECEYVTYAYVNNGTIGYSIFEDKAESTTLRLINTTNGKIKIDDQIVGQVDEMVNGKYYLIYSGDGPARQQYVNDLYYDIDPPTDITIVKSKLEILGDDTGLVQLNNDVINMDITLENSTLHLGLRDNVLDNNNLALNSGTLSMINNQVGVSALNSLTVTGDTNVLVDVDLANKTMDRFTASEYGSHGGNLNVTGMNLLSDAVGPTTEILFAEQGLKDNVINKVQSVVDNANQTTLYTPIYKYNVSYENREDAGYFVFT
ncbi:hypothetical protein IKL64_01465, partial [bacterium]|nr:hypothetical protein [bacterium]